MKPETKARILAPYVGCLDKNDLFFSLEDLKKVLTGSSERILPIQLKSIDNITDEDLSLIGGIEIISWYHSGILSLRTCEILRQLGYATPHTVIEDGKVVHYSVEQLVEEGLFKII